MKSMKADTSGERWTRKPSYGRNPSEVLTGAETEMVDHAWTKAKPTQYRQLMEVVVEKANMTAAYQRVMKNKGAGGVDGIEVPEFKGHLQETWQTRVFR